MNNRESIGHDDNSQLNGADFFIVDKIQSGIRSSMDKFIKEKEKELKRKLFADLDKICPAHTILATNSSYIVSSKIADATNRPDKVCNISYEL